MSFELNNKPRRLIFLLQNGIGFGHFRLALTLAKEFDKKNYEIIFITQAKSTKIFEDYDYKVFNFPLLYCLKSNNETLIFHKLINTLIDYLQPSLVIEDTYPDDFYLNLPALMNVPKLLIVNRLNATEFENYYYDGIIQNYEKLLILREKEDFISQVSAPEVKNYVTYSNRLFFCGNVFSAPSSKTCEKVRGKYNILKYEKTIVVNCGAGGWHIGENICKKIFNQTIKISNELSDEGYRFQFIIVTGPYSSYVGEECSINNKNKGYIKLIDFEENLDALLKIADLVILRPGYNATMEALSGTSKIILLPGISYMEEQDEWCEQLKNKYNIEYINVKQLNLLKSKILESLEVEQIPRRKLHNNSRAATEFIDNTISNLSKIHNEHALFIFNTQECKSNKVLNMVKKIIEIYGLSEYIDNKKDRDAFIKDRNSKILVANVYNEKIEDIGIHQNVLAIYDDEQLQYNRKEFYEMRYHFEKKGTIVLSLSELTISGSCSFSMCKLINILHNKERFSNAIVLNISSSQADEKEILEFLFIIKKLLTKKIISNICINDLIGNEAENNMNKFKMEYYRPEITKLK